MYWILAAICFLTLLIIFMTVMTYFTLRKISNTARSDKYILNKFELDESVPKLTEITEFHKINENLSKYHIK